MPGWHLRVFKTTEYSSCTSPCSSSTSCPKRGKHSTTMLAARRLTPALDCSAPSANTCNRSSVEQFLELAQTDERACATACPLSGALRNKLHIQWLLSGRERARP